MRVNRRRWSSVITQILVWCGDEPLVLSYDGAEVWVPPIDKVAKPGLGSPYRLPSATTKAGIPIPGTIVVEDVIVETGEGGTKKVFNVQDFCDFLVRDCPQEFKRGFDIVSDPDDVRDVQTEGRPLYEQSLDNQASEIIDVELARRKRLEDQGRPLTAAPNEQEVVWAFRHKQKRGTAKPELSTADLFAAASGQFIPAAAPAAAPQATLAMAPDPKRGAAEAILDECEKYGVMLLKGELVALLRQDEEQIPIILEKLKAKKDQKLAADAERDAARTAALEELAKREAVVEQT